MNIIKNILNKLDIKFMVVIIMVTVYPLIVIPVNFSYFYYPRFVFLVLISLVSLFLFLRSRSISYKPLLSPLPFFLLFTLISSILSNDIYIAFYGNNVRYTGFLTYLFCAILMLVAANQRSVLTVIKAMVYTASIVSIIAIMQNYGINIVPHEGFRTGYHSYGTMGNPNFLGTYTVFILPAAMMLYMHLNEKKWLAISGLIFAALLTSLTRGAWLAFAGLYVVMLINYFKKPSLRYKLIILGTVFIFVFAIISLTTYDKSYIDRTASIADEITTVGEYKGSSVSIRIFVWKEAIEIFADNWTFGVGPDNLRVPVPRGYVEDKAFNIFLEIAVTMGVFALLSYLLLLYFCVKDKGSWRKDLFIFMILAYVFQGQFNIDVIMNLPLFWIVLGLTWSEAYERRNLGLAAE